MWLDEGRFDLLSNRRRLTPPPTAARIDQLIEARAWNDAALAARMEATSSRLRGRRMALLAFQTAESTRGTRRHCNRKSRSAALSDIRCACRSPPQDERYARHQFAGGTASSGNIWLRGLLR